jgi:hypothetical protein
MAYDIVTNKLTVIFISLSLLMTTSCGQRARQLAPSKGSKSKQDNALAGTGDANATLNRAYNPEAGKTCERTACPTVDIQILLTGPLSGKVNGFIAESGAPVNWSIKVANNDKRKMAIFPNNIATLHPISGSHIQGTTQQPQQSQTGTGQQPAATNTTSPFALADQAGAPQASQLPQQDFSAFKIDWPNPSEAEDKLTFTVRDLSQCVARSKEGAEALCTQFDQPHIVDRSVEVPYKIANGILGQAKDEHQIWEKLAGCLVAGVLDQSSVDPTTGAVIGGLVQGVFGQDNNCYGGVSAGPYYQDIYRNGSTGSQRNSGTYDQGTPRTSTSNYKPL